MKVIKILSSTIILFANVCAVAENKTNAMIHHETIQCDQKSGCEVVCKQVGDQWSTYLETKGDIEVTYFMATGVRQLKAAMGDGQFTILDTYPEIQSCRISGVVGKTL